jgi:hypothetical protein
MNSAFIIVGGELDEDPTQVCLPEHDQVVDALPPDRPDQSFCKQFCHGEPAEIGLSRMPMARRRRVTTEP